MTHKNTTALNIGQEAHRLASMPADQASKLENDVLLILAFHVGKESILSGKRLLFELEAKGYTFKGETRYFRDVINGLRKKGWPIGSTGGKNGGYWMCANWMELEAILKVQFHDFAMDLLEQESAMRKGASRWWGNQMSFVS